MQSPYFIYCTPIINVCQWFLGYNLINDMRRSKSKQIKAKEAEKKGGAQPPEASSGTDCPIDAPNHRPETKNPKKKFWRDWEPIEKFTFVIAISTVIYTVVSVFLYLTAAQTLKVSQRAFVYAEDPVLGGIHKPLVETGQPAWFGINILNSGETPARKTRFEANLCAASGTVGPDFNWAPFPSDDTPSLIAPKRGNQIGLEMPEPALLSVEAGKLHLLVYGTITYQDVFKEAHRTDFCFDYRGYTLNASGEIEHMIWAVCGAHECHDEDCPKIIGKAPCPGVCAQSGPPAASAN